MLKGRAAEFYYDSLSDKSYDFARMVQETRNHFETQENHQHYMSEWRETTYQRIIASELSRTHLECLQILFNRLQKIQQGLTEFCQTDLSLKDQVINACQGVPECSFALYQPADTYKGVCAQLQSAISTAT